MKKTILAVLLCSVLLCQNAFAATRFPDVPSNASYAEAVETLAEMGIIGGDEKGNFNPNNSITRAEAATMVCRLLGVQDEAREVKSSIFTDVPSTHWAVGYIAMANEMGIIGGYGNNKFGPSDAITVEQMATILIRVWGWEEQAKSEGGWPNGYVKVAKESGYFLNVTQDTKESAKRSTVATMLYNTMY